MLFRFTVETVSTITLLPRLAFHTIDKERELTFHLVPTGIMRISAATPRDEFADLLSQVGSTTQVRRQIWASQEHDTANIHEIQGTFTLSQLLCTRLTL